LRQVNLSRTPPINLSRIIPHICRKSYMNSDPIIVGLESDTDLDQRPQRAARASAYHWEVRDKCCTSDSSRHRRTRFTSRPLPSRPCRRRCRQSPEPAPGR
jgi:hypothetical protein